MSIIHENRLELSSVENSIIIKITQAMSRLSSLTHPHSYQQNKKRKANSETGT